MQLASHGTLKVIYLFWGEHDGDFMRLGTRNVTIERHIHVFTIERLVDEGMSLSEKLENGQKERTP